MALDDYDPSTALSAYFPNRDERRTARLWATEKLLHDLRAVGIVDFFEGPGSDPTALDGYASNKIWLRVSSGVTEAPGEIRLYDGVGDEDLLSNWPELTAAALAGFIPNAFSLSQHTSDNITEGSTKLLMTTSERGLVATLDMSTRASIAAATVVAAVDFIRTAGYATAGDGGGALYVRVVSEPSHAGKVQSDDGAWWELVTDESTTIAHYSGGATGIAAMEAHLGFVTFPRGNTAIGADITIDVPVRFQPGAYITVASTFTVTISSRIESERQHIFRGDGAYSLLGDGDSGEDSKTVHISWFGGFPTHNDDVDISDNIRAANAALGNVREGVIKFDNGAYFLSDAATILINRGVALEGVGSRRTVFRVTTADVDIFTTNEAAAKFKDIQFELSGHTARTAWYIVMAHDDAEATNISFQSGLGIDMRGNRGRVENIISNFAANLAAGSSLVRVGGSGNRVRGVQSLTSAFGPEALVRIGGLSGAGAFDVQDVQSILPVTKAVVVDGSAGNIVRGTIDGVIYSGSSGTAPDYVVDFDNSSTFTMSDITLSKIIGPSYVTNGIRLRNSGSGTLEDIQLALISISGSSGIGVELVRSAGTMRDVFIDSTVNVAERATPISYSGTITNVRVSPAATPNANHAYCYLFSVADDSVATINLQRSVFTGTAILTVGSTHYGMWVIRAATTPAINAMITASADVNTSTSALAGTTGSDAKVTISVQAAGVIQVENRLGSTQNVHLTILAGH